MRGILEQFKPAAKRKFFLILQAGQFQKDHTLRMVKVFTLYTITSVCKFSLLFCVHFSWYLNGEFV